MIVWGGYNSGTRTNTNTGGRYNPTTNTWTETTTTGAPTSRDSHTAVWTGTEMIVWGGYQGTGASTNTGGRYNPITNSWTGTSTTGAPTSRYRHTAVWTGTEMIVWGGGGQHKLHRYKHRRALQSFYQHLDGDHHHRSTNRSRQSHSGLDRN